MDQKSILDYFQVGGEEKHLVSSPQIGTHNIFNMDHKVISIGQLDNLVSERINNINITSLEFTVTFKPEFRTKYKDLDIAQILKRYLYRQLKQEVYYILYPEYGDNLNLHYHGILYTELKRVKTYFSDLSKYIKRDVGLNTIRQIRNTTLYIEYMKKERKTIDPIDFLKLVIFKI